MKRALWALLAFSVLVLLALTAPDPDDFAQCMTHTGSPEMCAVRTGLAP